MRGGACEVFCSLIMNHLRSDNALSEMLRLYTTVLCIMLTGRLSTCSSVHPPFAQTAQTPGPPHWLWARTSRRERSLLYTTTGTSATRVRGVERIGGAVCVRVYCCCSCMIILIAYLINGQR